MLPEFTSSLLVALMLQYRILPCMAAELGRYTKHAIDIHTDYLIRHYLIYGSNCLGSCCAS